MSRSRLPLTEANYRAVLDRHKTLTCRVMQEPRGTRVWGTTETPRGIGLECEQGGELYIAQYAPYQPGDRPWLTLPHWRVHTHTQNDQIWDEVTKVTRWPDGMQSRDVEKVDRHFYHKLAAMFMPVWAALHQVEITEVRALRVQDLSEADLLAEGVFGSGLEGWQHPGAERSWETMRRAYRAEWDSLNSERGYPYDDNPWVWCYGFELTGES